MSKRNLPNWILPDSISENSEVPPRRQLRSNSSLDKKENKVPEIPKKPIDYPPIKYDGKIEYYTEFVDIAETSEKLLNWVIKQEADFVPIAFDMEWPFNFKTGPGKTAVIQLCADINVCYVFQLTNVEKLPVVLLELLRHPKVKLHGVNIKNDFRKLERDFPGANAQIMIDHCIDLGVWCNTILNSSGRFSLERLVLEICKLKIDKNKAVRMSKWHEPLNIHQQLYAAIDVYISQVIYEKLEILERNQKYGLYSEDNVEDLKIPKFNLEYNEYPTIEYKGQIKYYNTFIDIADSCEEILNWVNLQENLKIIPIAFDLEWPFNFKTGPGKSSLIKLCLEIHSCYLYHLSELQKLPMILSSLFTHNKVKMHGVKVKENLSKLFNDFPGTMTNCQTNNECVDLGNWNNNILEKNYFWSLNELAVDTCKLRSRNNFDLRMNEWHIIPLNDELKLKAAVDIYISQIIYFELEKREKEKEETINAFVEAYGNESLAAVNKLI